MSVERKARIANGFLVLASAVLAMSYDPRFIWITVFMGASLIYSGAADFCGFAVILRKLERRS